MMDHIQILKDLKNKVYHPVYFLMGEEPYFIDVISDYIEKNALDANEKEFNQTVLYGRDVDASAVISAAKRFPMMSNYQVVIVKEAQNIRDLVGRSKESEDDEPSPAEEKSGKQKSAFQAYLEKPQKSTILVFCYKYKTVDKRTAIAKLLVKNAVLFESKPLYDNQVPAWINTYLKGKDFVIGPQASALMAEYLGADLSKIANELDKLMISLPSKSEITTEHIQNNIGISKDYNVFELQTALGKREVLKANRIINYFAANPKEHPFIMTISSLNGYFNKLIKYHYASDKSKNGIAAALGVHPFFTAEYDIASRNYPMVKLRDIFACLREFDLKSKGVGEASASDAELLKELIFRILH